MLVPAVEDRVRHRLELQALIIDSILAAMGIYGRVNGGEVTGTDTVMHLDVVLPLLRRGQVVRALQEKLGVQVQVSGQEIRVAHPRRPVLDGWELLDRVARNAQAALRPGQIVLGLTPNDRPVVFNALNRLTPHCLIVAPAGWGKTSLLRHMAVWTALTHDQREAQMVLVGGSDKPVTALPHAVTGSVDKVKAIVQRRRRYGNRRPLLFVFVDGGVGDGLGSLLTDGPAVGVHVIAATDRPERMTRYVQTAFGLMLLGKMHEDMAWGLTGIRYSGADELLTAGEFVAAVGQGQAVAFHAAAINDYDLHMIVAGLHRQINEQRVVTVQPRRRPPFMRPEIPAGVRVEL